MKSIRDALYEVIRAEHPATLRGTFYQAVSRGLIDKTEQSYKRIGRLLSAMRRDGQLPFEWIADNTRWQRKPTSYEGIADLLQQTSKLYRRSVWGDQPAYVEIWLEKDALAGVLFDVTSEFDVPLMVTKGYPSVTFLHSAAQAVSQCGKPAHLYYFGDQDPSGVDIPRKVEAGIREFAPKADVHFQCVAVTPEQISQYGLPTRPTKQSDSRAKKFGRESVEVDALPPRVLRQIARDCIERHIDRNALNTLLVAERSEKEFLARAAERVKERGGIN